jgi:MucR family transcriptional regulator, transcriptional regulator of exopolysaccharide biosynthesis
MVYGGSKRENLTMSDDPPSASVDRELTTQIVAAYVRRNQIAADQLPGLIATVYRALGRLAKPLAEPASERTPAVPIRRSVTRDFVICLDCGWKGSVLRRHLMISHGLSPDQYRASWNLKPDHPVTAPGYSERRSMLAKQIGFGQRGRRSRTTAAPKTPTPQKRPGRPRTPRS